MKLWKCASDSGWPERIWGQRRAWTMAYDGVEVGLHQLLVQVHLVEHARSRRVEHNVHVIEAAVSWIDPVELTR
jgi:hypothetical protein